MCKKLINLRRNDLTKVDQVLYFSELDQQLQDAI